MLYEFNRGIEMSLDLDMNEIERKVYMVYNEDGLVDIALGFVFLAWGVLLAVGPPFLIIVGDKMKERQPGRKELFKLKALHGKLMLFFPGFAHGRFGIGLNTRREHCEGVLSH